MDLNINSARPLDISAHNNTGSVATRPIAGKFQRAHSAPGVSRGSSHGTGTKNTRSVGTSARPQSLSKGRTGRSASLSNQGELADRHESEISGNDSTGTAARAQSERAMSLDDVKHDVNRESMDALLRFAKDKGVDLSSMLNKPTCNSYAKEHRLPEIAVAYYMALEKNPTGKALDDLNATMSNLVKMMGSDQLGRKSIFGVGLAGNPKQCQQVRELENKLVSTLLSLHGKDVLSVSETLYHDRVKPFMTTFIENMYGQSLTPETKLQIENLLDQKGFALYQQVLAGTLDYTISGVEIIKSSIDLCLIVPKLLRDDIDQLVNGQPDTPAQVAPHDSAKRDSIGSNPDAGYGSDDEPAEPKADAGKGAGNTYITNNYITDNSNHSIHIAPHFAPHMSSASGTAPNANVNANATAYATSYVSPPDTSSTMPPAAPATDHVDTVDHTGGDRQVPQPATPSEPQLPDATTGQPATTAAKNTFDKVKIESPVILTERAIGISSLPRQLPQVDHKVKLNQAAEDLSAAIEKLKSRAENTVFSRQVGQVTSEATSDAIAPQRQSAVWAKNSSGGVASIDANRVMSNAKLSSQLVKVSSLDDTPRNKGPVILTERGLGIQSLPRQLPKVDQKYQLDGEVDKDFATLVTSRRARIDGVTAPTNDQTNGVQVNSGGLAQTVSADGRGQGSQTPVPPSDVLTEIAQTAQTAQTTPPWSATKPTDNGGARDALASEPMPALTARSVGRAALPQRATRVASPLNHEAIMVTRELPPAGERQETQGQNATQAPRAVTLSNQGLRRANAPHDQRTAARFVPGQGQDTPLDFASLRNGLTPSATGRPLTTSPQVEAVTDSHAALVGVPNGMSTTNNTGSKDGVAGSRDGWDTVSTPYDNFTSSVQGLRRDRWLPGNPRNTTAAQPNASAAAKPNASAATQPKASAAAQLNASAAAQPNASAAAQPNASAAAKPNASAAAKPNASAAAQPSASAAAKPNASAVVQPNADAGKPAVVLSRGGEPGGKANPTPDNTHVVLTGKGLGLDHLTPRKPTRLPQFNRPITTDNRGVGPNVNATPARGTTATNLAGNIQRQARMPAGGKQG